MGTLDGACLLFKQTQVKNKSTKQKKVKIMPSEIVEVIDVQPYGERLSLVKLSNDRVIVANRKEDGSFRWEIGDIGANILEGSIIPDMILKSRGYWDEEKNRGLLDGNKKNVVKNRKWGPDKIIGEGLLFKVEKLDAPFEGENRREIIGQLVEKISETSVVTLFVALGDNVDKWFGIETK